MSGITPEVSDAFLRSRPRHRPRSFNHLLGVLHRLFEWLVARDIIARSPARSRTRPAESGRVPVILGPDQARRLLELTARLPDTSGCVLRGSTYHAMFATLYGLGLRVSEACRLNVGDVDRRQLLVIRDCRRSPRSATR